MKSTERTQLDASDDVRAVKFHVRELVEIGETLRSLLRDLESAAESDPRVAADTFTRLDVEIFDHIGYHLKQVKKPLKKLARRGDATGADA